MSVNPKSNGNGVFERLYYRYTYDSLGNITGIQELDTTGAVAGTTSYSYDHQGQLTTEADSRYGTWTYDYDTYGNLRSKTDDTDVWTYTYGNSNWLDQLTALSVTENGITYTGTYSYDGSGNPTSYFNPGDHSQWTMTWRNGRQLATAANGAHSLSYGYDVNGLRTYKVVDGVRHEYIYASGKLLQETWTQSGVDYRLEFLYDQNGSPFLLNYTVGNTTTAYYYLCNLQGDVVELVTAAGVPAATYRYNAWGHIEASTGSMAAVNPLRYRGYYYDTETGFYYLQSRYYDPALGRFINADGYASTGDGFLGYNMYVYCDNTPINGTDPNGDSPMQNIDVSDCKTHVLEWNLCKCDCYTGSRTNLYLDSGTKVVGDIVFEYTLTQVDDIQIPDNCFNVLDRRSTFYDPNENHCYISGYKNSLITTARTVNVYNCEFWLPQDKALDIYVKYKGGVTVKYTVTVGRIENNNTICTVGCDLCSGIINATGNCGGIINAGGLPGYLIIR